MNTALKDILRILHDAGAEDVPAEAIDWHQSMTPVLIHALNMGYIRYRDRNGARYFDLTDAGYQALGLNRPQYSAWRALAGWLSRMAGRRGTR